MRPMPVLLTPIFLAVRLVLPGAAWAWCFPLSDLEGSRGGRSLLNAARILISGIALNALAVVVLAQAGWFAPSVDFAAWVGLSLAGLVTGWVRRRSMTLRYLKDAAWVAPTAAAWLGLTLLLPERGEWLVGGWDPGVYQNQGIHVANHHGFRTKPDKVYAELNAQEFNYFTRNFRSYREAMPAVPIDGETRSYEHYFFRLTPSLTALLYRVGGLPMMVRINLLLAPVAVLGLAAMLFALTSAARLSGIAPLLLATSPIFVYHTHLPTTEMLHLVLLCGLGLTLYGRSRRGGGLLMLSLLLALALLNRLAFLPFAGLLLVLMAWLDLRRTDRARCAWEHGVVTLAATAAAVFDYFACHITLARLVKVTPLLAAAFLGGVLVLVLLDLLAARDPLRRRVERLATDGLRWTLTALLAGGTAVYLLSLLPGVTGWLRARESLGGLHEVLFVTDRLLAYLGRLAGAGALAGGWLVVRRARTMPRELLGWCLFGMAATAVLIVRPSIWLVFPWALRRFVPYTLPVVAVLNACVISRLWAAHPPGFKRAGGSALAAAALVGLLFAQAGQTLRAWTSTDYHGSAAAIETLARELEPGDVVVADSPRWGTPLALAYDFSVLNGKRLWYKQDADGMAPGLATLGRLHHLGYRIRFLTSTEEGLGVFPGTVGKTRELWAGEPATFLLTTQSAGARDFVRSEVTHRFRIFTWAPE
jgi:hypothetical protein